MEAVRLSFIEKGIEEDEVKFAVGGMPDAT